MMKRFLLIWLLGLLLIACDDKKLPLSPSTALEKYINNGDENFSWVVKDEFDIEELHVAVLKVMSQEWRGIKWTHQVTVISPPEISSNGALLFINGGSNEYGEPNWRGKDDGALRMMSLIAKKNKAVVAILSQVPNQPLFGELTEDALISYTLHNYRNDRDLTWPLLFPMTKSAVRAMDAVQEYSRSGLKSKISGFVVSGASKRGWTTWLTASQDKRVIAIAPMVIDVLNMPVNIDYQKQVWGDYSIEIQDYVNLGIAQDINTDDGRELTTMIDPYSYRERIDMPKMIFIGTNDPYWPVDAVKHYIAGIPGENYIHYVPNTGHDLGDGREAIQVLSAFFNMIINKRKMPECKWEIRADSTEITVNINASDDLVEAYIWQCNSLDRDFRDDIFDSAIIEPRKFRNLDVIVKYPESGYRAFYIELVYPDPVDGEYSVTTRMFVAGEKELFLN